jgi:hypothetical protein
VAHSAGGKNNNGIWAKVLAYVTNRAIMKRLDEVCGKAGWRNEYRDIPNNGGVECGISIKVEGEWITKWDAAENTQVEAVKGGRSGAMKRAAVQWGIGRYLYNLEEGFAVVSATRAGFQYAKSKEVGVFYWKAPALPGWALPSGTPTEQNQQPHDGHQQETRHLSPWMRTKSSPNSLHTLALKTIAIGLSIAMKTHGNCLTDLLSTRTNAKTLLAFDSKNLNRRRKWLAKA